MPQLNVSIFNFYNIHSIQFFDCIQLIKNIYIKINQFSGGYGGYGGYGMGGWGMRRRMMMMGGCKFNRLEKKNTKYNFSDPYGGYGGYGMGYGMYGK